MSTNLSIESPNFEQINKESGQFTSDAMRLLWYALNDTRASERRDFRQASQTVAPLLLTLSPTGSVNNQELNGASVVSFIGGGAQNLTGFKAPSTGVAQVLFIQVSGGGTITVKNNATSETANRIITSTGGDVALSTGKGIILAYLASSWREVARSG